MTNDQKGIPIARNAFDELMRTSIRQMGESIEPNEEECIAMVRVYNTIALIPDAKRSEMEVRFLQGFAPKYLKVAVVKLDASLTKGMAYYSAKFNLCIGGNPNHNSLFSIE